MKDKYITPISCCEINCQPEERLIVNRDFLHLFSSIPNLSFATFFENNKGEVIKEIQGRTVSRITIPFEKEEQISDNIGISENGEYFYIKKHFQQFNSLQTILSLLKLSQLESEGIREFNNYCLFRSNEIATAIPVAAGEKYLTRNKVESFVITKSYSPLSDIEALVLNTPEVLSGPSNINKRKNILRSVGQFARYMHNCGLNHKDFNANHVLIDDVTREKLTVALFDLQRVDTNKLYRFKWAIKALAEFNYTLPASIFTNEDRRFLFCSYLGRRRLTLLDKIQWLLIRHKTDRIAKHSAKRGLAPKMNFD